MAPTEPNPLILSGKCMHKESEQQRLSVQQAAEESSFSVSSIPSSIWRASKKAKMMVTKAGMMLSKAGKAVKKLTKHKASDQSDNTAGEHCLPSHVMMFRTNVFFSRYKSGPLRRSLTD